MTVTSVYIVIQKEGGEASATHLIVSDRDAGIIAGALARCPGLIPGEISSILGGAFSQLQAVVAKAAPVNPLSLGSPQSADGSDSEVRYVNADRISQPPPAGVKPVNIPAQATDPMRDVRRAAAENPAVERQKAQEGIDPAAQPTSHLDRAMDPPPAGVGAQPFDDGIRETAAGQPLDPVEPKRATETKFSDDLKR